MLTVSNINTFYGSSHVVQHASLSVKRGETVVLLGRNGAGKTTLLKSIMGVQPPASGEILFKGKNITGWAPERVARLGICLIPEDRQIFANLSVMENLQMGMLAHKKKLGWRKSLDKVFSYFPVLRERLGQNGGSLSGGEQQMLAIARGLVSGPELMLMDEPSEGLMPVLVDEVAQILEKLQKDGVAVLLVEQNYSMAMSLGGGPHAYILEKGRIKLHGRQHELAARQGELEKCLGVKLN